MPGAAVEHRVLALLRRGADARPDAELLTRMCDDPAAFEELVARHGPLVWGVCRNMLAGVDSEDAFQATFIALLRSKVRDGSVLSSWLHTVAVRVSLAARREAGRRRRREQVAAKRESTPPAAGDWEDTMAVVHREIAALPGAERSAFVLCVLEGLTQTETADRLGRTPGAVAGQVARAKKRLVARLTGRGIVPVLAALGTASSTGAVPPGLAVEAAGWFVGDVSPAALRLAKGAIAMTPFRAKLILAAAVAAVGVTAGVLTAGGNPPPDPPPAAAAKPPEKTPPAGPPTPLLALTGHTDRVTAVAFSPDGTAIASAAWDGTTRIWDAATGKELRRLEFPNTKGYNSFNAVAFSRDGASVVTSVRESTGSSVVVIWDRRTGKQLLRFPSETGSIAVSPDGKLIAAGGCRIIRFHEFATGKLVREIRGDEKQLRIESLAFTPDGKSLISTGHPETPQRGDGVHRLTIMPDVARVWDVATGTERPHALNGVVVCRFGQHIALSPDGRTLVSPTGHEIVLRETATGAERAKLAGHKDEACNYAFTADGRTMASGSMDGTVRLWDVPSGADLGVFGKPVDPFKGGWILSVAFSPDGRSLVAGGLNKTVEVWDVARITGRPRATAERSVAELAEDWKDLAGDSVKGYAAIRRLVASPESAVPFLGKQLQDATAVDAEQITRLIAALDDKEFRTREQASKDLGTFGDRAAPALRKALADTTSAEVRQRLGQLVAKLDAPLPPAETLRVIRAVEALEAVRTPEARRWLGKLAAGPAGLRLTQEAKASFERTAPRP